MSKLLSITEMAERLGFSAKTFAKYVKSDGIPHRVLGRRKRFDPREVAVFLYAASGFHNIPVTDDLGLHESESEAHETHAHRRRRQLYTYLIWAVNSRRYKIGSAFDPHKRLQGLNTGSPLELRLLAAIPAAKESEEALHRRFRKYRVKGEWFQFPSPDIVLPCFGRWIADFYCQYVGREA